MSFALFSLKDVLWANSVYLKEANAIAVELKKNIRFQHALFTDTIYSPLSNDLRLVSDRWKRTIVAIELKNIKTSAVHYWSMEKFRFVSISLTRKQETLIELTIRFRFELIQVQSTLRPISNSDK